MSDQDRQPAATASGQRKSLAQLRHLTARSLRLAWAADRRLFSTNAVLQLIAGIVGAVTVLVTKQVVDAMIGIQNGTTSATDAVLPVLALAAVTAFTTVSSAVQQFQTRLLGELVSRLTWNEILDVAGSVSLRSFETPEFFDQLNRVQTNAITRPLTLTQGLIGLVGGIFGSIGLALAIVTLNPLLLPLLLLSGVPLLLATRRGSRLEFAFTRSQIPRQRMRGYLTLTMSGREQAAEIRGFGMFAALKRRYDTAYGAYIGDLRVHIRRRTRLAFVSTVASSVLLAFTLLTLVWLIKDDRLSVAQAAAALVAVRLLAAQLTMLFSSAQQIFESGLFLADLDDFLDKGAAAVEQQGGRQAPRGFQRLHVEDLSFTYPGSHREVLRGVNLDIAQGQVVALVGENGSGKSTLAKLLANLFEPVEGRVTWDGVDLRDYDRAGLRASIAVIFQDFVQYQLSATDNIALGRPDDEADPALVRRAAARAGADDFLSSFPAGYDTLLSKMFDGGFDLSRGQWQRLAIARAYYRDAPFVILDEPSASLDPRAEADLFQSLREVLAGKTVLYISHRMSTVRDADWIYVMREGQVAEQGKHAELMARSGLYAELFTLQASAYGERDT